MTRDPLRLRRVRRNKAGAAGNVRRKKPDDDAVEDTGGNAGEDHDRKIIEEIPIGNKENGNDELAEVVKNAAGHADAVEGEAAGLAGGFSFLIYGGENRHSGETEGGPGKGIQCAEGTGKEKAGEQNADEIDKESGAGSHAGEHEDNDKIRKSQLDAGETGLKREDGFNP